MPLIKFTYLLDKADFNWELGICFCRINPLEIRCSNTIFILRKKHVVHFQVLHRYYTLFFLNIENYYHSTVNHLTSILLKFSSVNTKMCLYILSLFHLMWLRFWKNLPCLILILISVSIVGYVLQIIIM